MGILLHYTDLDCVKLKLLMEIFPENSRSQHVNVFQHCLVLSMQKTGPVEPFYMAPHWVVQLLSPHCMVMQKKSIQTSIFCHHQCPPAALIVECTPIIFNFLHSQSQSQTTLKFRPQCIICKARYSNRR